MAISFVIRSSTYKDGIEAQSRVLEPSIRIDYTHRSLRSEGASCGLCTGKPSLPCAGRFNGSIRVDRLWRSQRSRLLSHLATSDDNKYPESSPYRQAEICAPHRLLVSLSLFARVVVPFSGYHVLPDDI
jgi:hypothetical protein